VDGPCLGFAHEGESATNRCTEMTARPITVPEFFFSFSKLSANRWHAFCETNA
jgi:hypothetical protein